MKKTGLKLCALAFVAMSACTDVNQPIDREDLVERNNPHVTSMDSLSSLTVGNGEFAYTVDVTGLQTFPERYSSGVPLGTMSQWAWHNYPNPQHYALEECTKYYDFGHGQLEPYPTQDVEPGRPFDAMTWYRESPHRLHLGSIGFDGLMPEQINNIDQTLDLWRGQIYSSFTVDDVAVEVQTACDSRNDMMTAYISTPKRLPIVVCFAYPTGYHTDDGCDWNANDKHHTEIVDTTENCAILKRVLDETTYYVKVQWQGDAQLGTRGANAFVLIPSVDDWAIAVQFTGSLPDDSPIDIDASQAESAEYWANYWQRGAAVDFSHCTDPRARELERRVVLSQYLLAVNCAGSTPPAETGLTCNSWYGKFHLEMIWWHQAQFALWGHEDMLARTLPWYHTAEEAARQLALSQGFDGIRWMKMTDPTGAQTPSVIAPFLVWQQPHLIYLAELLYRACQPADGKPMDEQSAMRQRQVLDQYYDLIMETAKFMASFATYDTQRKQYTLKGLIPAQETMRPEETLNPPFELSYWHFGLGLAQLWRERKGEPRVEKWDDIMQHLSPLAAQADSLYLASESAVDTYTDRRFTSDHMAVLAALGVLPDCHLIDKDKMHKTLLWVIENWNWDQTWGWDFPTTAMNAVRLGEPELAIDALLMDQRTNTYLPNGHNYQNDDLRLYLPGNGGLLTAVAMMCAGWDGCDRLNPGFPNDGRWDVRWEGLRPCP